MGTSPFLPALARPRALLALALLACAARADVPPVDSLRPVVRPTPPAWHVLGDAPASPGGVFCPQILVAPDGTPHLAFQDFTAPAHRLGVRTFRSGAWVPFGAGYGSAGDAWYNRLAFDAQGALLVATRDYGLGGQLGVRRCTGATATWSVVGGLASAGDAHYTDVAVLPSGAVAAIYQDATTTPAYGTTVVALDASGAHVLGAPGLALGYSAYQSLAVAPDGTLYAAFTDSARGDRAVVARYDAASDAWQPVGVPGFTPEVANNLILRVAPDGTPYVAYYVWNNRVVVRYWNGAAWPQLGNHVSAPDVPAVETEGWRQWLALDFDPLGRPWVAYQSATLARRATVKRWEPTTGAWLAVGPQGFTPSAADYLCMDLGPDGTPYVAFRDGATLRAVVMVWR